MPSFGRPARRAPAAGSDAGRPGQGSAVARTGRAPAAQPGHDRRGPGPRPHQRRSSRWSQKAGGGNVDPNIRSRVNTDTKTINDSDKTFIDSLIFWQDTPPAGVVIDPTKEQQRIRDAQAAGQPASGQTPTIKRRQRGLLEGIF